MVHACIQYKLCHLCWSNVLPFCSTCSCSSFPTKSSKWNCKELRRKCWLKMKAALAVVFGEFCISEMKRNEIGLATEQEFTCGQYISISRCSPSLLVRWWVSMKSLKDSCTTVCACFQMAIIFNQEGLKAVRPPCVIQSFINHNAVLYKVFVVGESYTVVKRPSLKNFSAGISGTLCRFKRKCQFSEPW